MTDQVMENNEFQQTDFPADSNTVSDSVIEETGEEIAVAEVQETSEATEESSFSEVADEEIAADDTDNEACEVSEAQMDADVVTDDPQEQEESEDVADSAEIAADDTENEVIAEFSIVVDDEQVETETHRGNECPAEEASETEQINVENTQEAVEEEKSEAEEAENNNETTDDEEDEVNEGIQGEFVWDDSLPSIESVVEAVLFASDEPVNASRLMNIIELGSTKQVRTAVDKLNRKYKEIGSAFHIEKIAGGYQMMTHSVYNSWLQKMIRTRSESKLTQAAMETLAIVAYKQPIIRADVEAIRGVASGEMIRGLMYKGLVKIVGRAEVIGRPVQYGTTRKFLEVFGLNSLRDLPKVEELKKPG